MLKEKKSRLFTGKKLLVILLAVFAIQTQAQTDLQHLNVLATNGLNMREKPQTDSRIITKVLFNKQVQVLEKTDVSLQLGWIKDHWYKVRYRGREGYIFGGYLSKFAAPQKMDVSASLAELLLSYSNNGFSPQGSAIRSIETNRDGDTLRHTLQRFVGGVELETEQEGDLTSVFLLLNSDVEKAYVLIEALLKKAGKKELIEELRFVKGKDGKLERISNPNRSIRIRRLSAERVEIKITSFTTSRKN